MGAWGPAIFSDDLACDVRDTYRELVEDGVDDDEAVERVLAQFRGAGDDPEEGTVFWVALALSQSKIGRLREDVKARALAAIDAGADLLRWEEKDRRRRAAALEKARVTLDGPQPARKRVRPPSRHATTLVAGDVLALALDDGPQLLRVARIDDTRLSVAPILVSLLYDGATVPAAAELARLPDRPEAERRPDPATGRLPKWSGTTFRPMVLKKVDYADAAFTIVGSVPARHGDEAREARIYLGWQQLADHLRRPGP